MNTIGPYLRNDSTADDARALLAERPAIAEKFEKMTASDRSRNRKRLLEVYPSEVVDVVIPRRAVIKTARPDSAWGFVSGPVRARLLEALEGEPAAAGGELSLNAADWDEKTANAAADAIAALYENPTTATLALTGLRQALRAINAGNLPDEIREATLRPDLTRAHNAKIEEVREEKAARPIDAPAPLQRIRDIRARLEAWLAGGDTSPMVAVDLAVALSARKNELQTLEIGPRGGLTGYVKGILKKRGADGQHLYPVASLLGAEMAQAALDKWRALPQGDRSRLMRDRGPLLREWGITAPTLRKIGGELATRKAGIDGAAETEGQARDVRRAALRQEAPPVGAVDFYTGIRNPTAREAAQLAELSPEALADIRAIIARDLAA